MAIKPHDPRKVGDPETVGAEIGAILAEPAADLNEELEQLSRAHGVLREALQEN
ncbi:hypothetical protein [Corynebacterium flavescens]|uniref:hypothetical protein n=1 Tax=Corynebacterium flavescens TaxID=28028 RepID=UPI003FD206CD